MNKNILLALILALGISFSACDRESSGDSTITHNGITYGTVTSPYTGAVWLDRNLGASQVCTALDDTACYGDYYQWGRNFDGHEKGNSAITNEQAVQIDPVQQDIVGMFIVNSSDWTASGVDDGSLRIINWSKTDGTSVCPVQFRVPTEIELKAETVDEGDSNSSAIFTVFLKLPSAGYRRYDGSLSVQGSSGRVWSSSGSSISSRFLSFDPDRANTFGDYPSSGLSVRCIKD